MADRSGSEEEEEESPLDGEGSGAEKSDEELINL